MKKQIAFILLVAAGVAAAVYYFFNRGQSLFGDYMEQQAAENAMLADCPYERDFCSYLAAQAKAMVRGVMIETAGFETEAGVMTSKLLMDGAGSMSTESYLDGKLQSHVIVYAGQTYLQDLTDQAWFVLNVDPNQAVSNEDESSYQPDTGWLKPYELDTILTVNKLGTEACGDLTCDKYELVSSAEMANPPRTYVWVDTKERLARRMEIVSPESEPLVMTYSYDLDVSISRPEPLKDMPALVFPTDNSDEQATDSNPGAGATYPGAGGDMPSSEELEEMMRQYGLDR